MYPKWNYPNYNPTYKRLTKSPAPPSTVKGNNSPNRNNIEALHSAIYRYFGPFGGILPPTVVRVSPKTQPGIPQP